MKKILSCVLASVLAFGLTSCSLGGNASENSQVGTSSSIEEKESAISFVNSELNMEIGESVQAEVTTSKKNVYIFWSIRDKDIAKVDSNGMITALASGETVCYAEFGGETAMCLIKVKEKSATPELSVSVPYYNNQVSLYAGAELNLNANVRMGDEIVTDATVEYEVADTQIATMNNGKVVGGAIGTTTVTITATYNGQTAVTEVTVQVLAQAQGVKAITVKGQMTKFTIGDKFVFDGIVDVEYTDGTTESNINYYTIDTSKYNAAKLGTYEITVSLGEVSYTYNVTVNKATTLKLLMIGNSFSQDTVEWMPQIAKSLGFTDIVIGNLMIGGCTLETHYQNVQNNAALYLFDYYQNGTWTRGADFTTSILTGLRFAEWDFVSLQQQSGASGNPATYNSALDGMIDYVKSNALNSDVRLVWNMTWAYPAGSGWFGGLYNNDQMEMYNAITSTVQAKIVTNDNFVLISPAGTAIQNGRTSYIGDYYPGEGEEFAHTRDEWNRDGAHLTEYEGRFTSSLSMFCTLTGYTPDEISYVPPANIDDLEARVIRESVKNALANPFAVTNSNY
ncbi:MAG: DUF4886 domain-containing protein [Clostridia bacterium]|nr:DUF4886 domain-containing protein [Clostridia bacterium]